MVARVNTVAFQGVLRICLVCFLVVCGAPAYAMSCKVMRGQGAIDAFEHVVQGIFLNPLDSESAEFRVDKAYKGFFEEGEVIDVLQAPSFNGYRKYEAGNRRVLFMNQKYGEYFLGSGCFSTANFDLDSFTKVQQPTSGSPFHTMFLLNMLNSQSESELDVINALIQDYPEIYYFYYRKGLLNEKIGKHGDAKELYKISMLKQFKNWHSSEAVIKDRLQIIEKNKDFFEKPEDVKSTSHMYWKARELEKLFIAYGRTLYRMDEFLGSKKILKLFKGDVSDQEVKEFYNASIKEIKNGRTR